MEFVAAPPTRNEAKVDAQTAGSRSTTSRSVAKQSLGSGHFWPRAGNLQAPADRDLCETSHQALNSGRSRQTHLINASQRHLRTRVSTRRHAHALQLMSCAIRLQPPPARWSAVPMLPTTVPNGAAPPSDAAREPRMPSARVTATDHASGQGRTRDIVRHTRQRCHSSTLHTQIPRSVGRRCRGHVRRAKRPIRR